MNTMHVRNPQSGKLEVKEFSGADAQLALLRGPDTIARNVVQGMVNQKLVGDSLFTPVKVQKRSGQFQVFGEEAFVIPTNIKRSIGEKIQRIQVQDGFIPLSLSEYSLACQVENSERNEYAGTPDQLVNGRLLRVAAKLALYREKTQSILATTYTGYASGLGLSGAALNWATSGEPITNMLDLLDLVQIQVGMRPNKVWFSPAAWRLVCRNASVLGTIQGGATRVIPAMVKKELIAMLLEVDEVIVPTAIYGTGSDGGHKKTTLTKGYLWEAVGNACAGVMVVGTGTGIEPAFGYTWELEANPVIESYYENQTKSQVWDNQNFYDPAITLNRAGAMYYNLA